jgi:flagellar assembly factor FliW
MTANNVAAQEPVYAAPPAPREDVVLVETRFGTMRFDRANAVRMPRGLLGYAQHHDFALADLPDPKLEQFKLLQCLSEPSLSFIVAPLNPESAIVAPADIESACQTLGIAYGDAAVLAVVATRRIGASTQISVNLRAPVIIDTRNALAWQHVLANNRYPVRHVIGAMPDAGDRPATD